MKSPGEPHHHLASACRTALLAALAACAHPLAEREPGSGSGAGSEPDAPAGVPTALDSLHVTSGPRASAEPGHFVVSPGGSILMPLASRPVTLEEDAPPPTTEMLAVGLAPTVRPLSPEVRERCGPGVPGMEDVLTPGAVVLLGELHGTKEIPALAGTLACHTASAGTPVVVALEVPREEQGAVDLYLESDGGAEARAELLQGTFWRRPYQDGRSSAARLELLERLRRWRQAGQPLSVLAFDVRGHGSVRASGLARRLKWARGRVPGGTLLVLVGNVQARVVRGAEWDPELSPMGWYLAREGLPVKSLDARFSGGTAWTCKLAPDGHIPCGESSAVLPRGVSRERGTHYRGSEPFVRLLDADAREGFHGVFYVGPVTASPPAVVPGSTAR